jgi:hypothetical protein
MLDVGFGDDGGFWLYGRLHCRQMDDLEPEFMLRSVSGWHDRDCAALDRYAAVGSTDVAEKREGNALDNWMRIADIGTVC